MHQALFIVGYWNSGTTLLVDLLRKHPDLTFRHARFKPNLEDRTLAKILAQVQAGFIDLGQYYQPINSQGFQHYQEPSLDPTQQARFTALFHKAYLPKPQKTLLLKNPWLWFMPRFIHAHFPDWHIKKIAIIRDGAMQVASKDYWLRAEEPERMLLARAKFWVRSMEYFFEHWHNQPNVYTLRYENLCYAPRQTLMSLCEAMSLDFAPLAPHCPALLENRRDKWDALEKRLQLHVSEIVADMQLRVDHHFPVW